MYLDLTVLVVFIALFWAGLGFSAMLICETKKTETCSEHCDHFWGFLRCGPLAFFGYIRVKFICDIFKKEKQDEKTKTQKGPVVSQVPE